MNLALIGYGKMGRMLDNLAPEYGLHVTARLDAGDAITRQSLHGAEVAIEFSGADAVPANVERLASLGIDIVEGTTGWLEHLPALQASIERHNTALVWSPNFSIGVNVFSRIVAEAARLLQNESAYEAWAWEIHHSAKKDAPSGTLLKLVEDMKHAGYSRPVDVSSNRAGAIPGTHEIGFDSQADTITLRHTARSRDGFARGALKAAQWIAGKKGFHEFHEVLFT
jgi:4-hydroxy-tetrahydrodipicolinate reductase